MFSSTEKLKAYTLIELIIVVVIVGLLAAITIPLYANYGGRQVYKQKVEEVGALINQTYYLSKNPEKDVQAYELTGDNDSNYYLRRCFNLVLDSGGTLRCDASNNQVVKQVGLLRNETIQRDKSQADPFLICYTDPNKSCIYNTANKFSFVDNNSSVNRAVSYSITTPFAVTWSSVSN